MPNAPTIKGNNTIIWGTEGQYTGLVVRARNRLTGEMDKVADNVGFTVSAIYFDDQRQCEVEIIVQTAAPTLARGDEVTICGVADCLVDETEQNWENKGTSKFTVQATRFLGMTLA